MSNTLYYLLTFVCLFIVCLPWLECRDHEGRDFCLLFTNVYKVLRTVSGTSGHNKYLWISDVWWIPANNWGSIQHGQESLLKIGVEFCL